MADTIDSVIAALVAEGSPTQLQWADRQGMQAKAAVDRDRRRRERGQ